MTGRKRKAGSSDQGGADRAKLHTDDITKNDQVCLSDLHQVYIDRIAKYLSFEDVGRLQLTCKDLFKKGLHAQRLFTIPLNVYIYNHVVGRFESPRQNRRSYRWTQTRLKATNFRFRIGVHVCVALTLKHIRKVTELLGGRGNINKMDFLLGGELSPELDRNLFSQFLQDFKASEIFIMEMPNELLQLDGVKQLRSLNMYNTFPLSPLYLLETAIHTCLFPLENRPERPDSAEMREILEKWTRNEKVIKDYTLSNFNWDEYALFLGWRVVDEGQGIPPVRPIVIRGNPSNRGNAYRVIRADGSCLSVNGRQGQLHVKEEAPRR